MQPEYLTVGNLFSSNWLYVVPLYQRPYVWNTNRWEPLWEDVERVADAAVSGGTLRPHFLGSIVVRQLDTGILQAPRREVIDGQQRMTTLQLLLKAAADAMDENAGMEEAARALRPLTHQASTLETSVEARYRVWPTNGDRDCFRAIMETDGAAWNDKAKHDKGDVIGPAYAYFRKQAQGWLKRSAPNADGQRVSRAMALSAVLQQGLRLIALNLQPDDQAQVIFETLNARGTPLLPADLVKNLLLRRAEAEGADLGALHKTHWESFDAKGFWRDKVGRGHAARARIDLLLLHSLQLWTSKETTASQPKEIAAGQLYDSFAAYLKSEQGRARSSADHLARLSALRDIARPLYEAKEADADPVQRFAARLHAMDFQTAFPVLLQLRSDPALVPSDVAQACNWLESFLVRRMVCGHNTRGYGDLFVKLLAKVAGQNPIAPAIASFLLGSDTAGKHWPDDKEFGQAWCNDPLYKTLRRDRLAMLLRALEMKLHDPDMTDPVPIPATLHIEHVLPQSWKEHWPLPDGAEADAEPTRERLLHTIGNLTLLKEPLNKAMSNAPWKASGDKPAKRPAFQCHGLFVLNQKLAAKDEWDEQAMHVRSKELLKTALEIWPRPA